MARVEFVIVELVGASPHKALALMVATRFGSSSGEDQEPHVEMQVGVLLGRSHAVNVDVDRRSHHRQIFEPGLFGGLSPGDPSEIGIAIGVTTRLEPTLQLGVEQQQARTSTRINDERRAGEMSRPTGSIRNIAVSVDQLEYPSADGVKVAAGRGPERLARGIPVARRRLERCRFQLEVVHSGQGATAK